MTCIIQHKIPGFLEWSLGHEIKRVCKFCLILLYAMLVQRMGNSKRRRPCDVVQVTNNVVTTRNELYTEHRHWLVGKTTEMP